LTIAFIFIWTSKVENNNNSKLI